METTSKPDSGREPAGYSRYAADFERAAHDSKPASDPSAPATDNHNLNALPMGPRRHLAESEMQMAREPQQGNSGQEYQGQTSGQLQNRSSSEWKRPEPQSFVTHWMQDYYHNRMADHTPPRGDVQIQEGYYHHRTPAHARSESSAQYTDPSLSSEQQPPRIRFGQTQSQAHNVRTHHEYYHFRNPGQAYANSAVPSPTPVALQSRNINMQREYYHSRNPEQAYTTPSVPGPNYQRPQLQQQSQNAVQREYSRNPGQSYVNPATTAGPVPLPSESQNGNMPAQYYYTRALGESYNISTPSHAQTQMANVQQAYYDARAHDH